MMSRLPLSGARRPQLLVFAASTRTGSINRRLAALAAAAARRQGADVDLLELADLPMPMYDGDLERTQGVPSGAIALADRLRAADALLIATPEYNGAFPALLKNVIDWASRVERGLLANKPIGLLSATPGPGGGRRVLDLTRTWLAHMRADTSPTPYSLPRAPQAFDADPDLPEPKRSELETFVAAALAAVAEPVGT
jgi:NAD(P)H-dependent FMN reductase